MEMVLETDCEREFVALDVRDEDSVCDVERVIVSLSEILSE